MFEHRKAPLISRPAFYRRVFWGLTVSLLLLTISLGIGILGYHYIGELPWIDSLLNASMILTGMGPVSDMVSDGSKLFASIYALFSGIAFLSFAAVLFAPIIHRFMHKFHLEPDEDESEKN
jgi:hypothetical protein